MNNNNYINNIDLTFDWNLVIDFWIIWWELVKYPLIITIILIFSVCRSQIGVVCGACRILLVYLLSKLPSNGKSELQLQQVMLSTKQLLLPIKALCTAKSMLSKSDQIVLTAIMKNAKLPPHIKTSMPGKITIWSLLSVLKN